jgi:hypothetical protein
MGGFTQLMMDKTEIVGASDQIHARLKRCEPTSGMSGFARQAGQSLPKGSIQALDKSGVEDAATTREQEQFLGLLQTPMSHLAGNLDHPFFLRSLDDGANVQLWPDLQTGSPDSPGLLDLLAESSADTVGIRAPSVCQDKKGAQAGRTSANLLHQGIGQTAITRELDHPTQPQARRNHHGQAHPGDHLASFHPNFIGLNVHQVQLPLFNDLPMHLLTMRSCSISPSGHRPLIQAKGMHNGLDWASIGQERDHDHHQRQRLAQALEHRSCSGAKGLLTDLAAIARALVTVDHDIALPNLPSCAASQIGAKCLRGLHLYWCVVFHRHSLQMSACFLQVLSPFHQMVILLANSKSGEIYHLNRLFFFSSEEYLSLFVLEKDGTSLRKSNSPTISWWGSTDKVIHIDKQ